MYIILKKISLKGLRDTINNSFKMNIKELEKKLNLLEKNNQDLKKEIAEIKRIHQRSSAKLDQLKIENSKDKLKIQYIETLLKEIHENTVKENKKCPICGSEFPIFLPFGHPIRENASCPKCGSLERDRASFLFLNEKTDIFNKPVKILHFAPEKSLAKIFQEKKNIDYLPVDINPEMENVTEKMDIQDIKYSDNTFDVVYCSHVLEHIPDDEQAISEMYRVLKPGGIALIMVPINSKLQKTLEDPAYNTPELRTKYYGQSDHLRYYGNDFPTKLEDAGFIVSDKFLTTKDENYLKKYGLKVYHYMYVCSK